MKKSLIAIALAMVLVFAFASVAYGYSLSLPAGGASSYYGYLSWGAANAYNPAGTTSPHGNYATSTVKCAVCHSVHKASTTGRVLTAWPGQDGAVTGTMVPYQSCLWCHGTSSPLFAISTIGNAATLSPHGYCGRCHTSSVHGSGGSAYPALQQKLLNTGGDADIATDLAAINTNVAIDMTTSRTDGAVAVGTGYLCGACHNSSDTAFPVTASGMNPAGGGANTTGHRIIASVTTNWNAAGEYDVYYSNAGAGQVAYNAVAGCKSCHDARIGDQATGAFAFPHNYVDSSGAVAAKNVLGSSYVWLTTAADADDPRVVSGKTQTGSGDIAGYYDGLCLKCHRSGDSLSGVGLTY